MSRPRAALEALLVCVALLSATGAAWAHEGGLGNQVMWTACEGRSVDDLCSFQSLDHDVFRGSCQAMSNAMVCVRNQPIERAAGSSHVHAPEPGPGASGGVGRGLTWTLGAFALFAGALAYFTTRRRPAA